MWFCVGGGDWTHDPGLMSPVLYQLSYPDDRLKLTDFRQQNNVAGARIERASGGYEPPELPLLHPAVF